MSTYACTNLRLWKTILNQFVRKNALYVRMEFQESFVSFWSFDGGSMILVFRLTEPYALLEEHKKSQDLVFDVNYLSKAFAKFVKASTSCSSHKLMVMDDRIQFIGYKENVECSIMTIKSMNDDDESLPKLDTNATSLIKEDCFHYLITLDMTSSDLSVALIALHEKQDTKIAIEHSEKNPTKGLLYLECNDDVEVATQKQFVQLNPRTESMLSTVNFDVNMHFRGIQMMSTFLTTLNALPHSNQKVAKKRKREKEDEEEEQEEVTNTINIQLKLPKGENDPVNISCFQHGFLGKLFITTKVNE